MMLSNEIKLKLPIHRSPLNVGVTCYICETKKKKVLSEISGCSSRHGLRKRSLDRWSTSIRTGDPLLIYLIYLERAIAKRDERIRARAEVVRDRYLSDRVPDPTIFFYNGAWSSREGEGNRSGLPYVYELETDARIREESADEAALRDPGFLEITTSGISDCGTCYCTYVNLFQSWRL